MKEANAIVFVVDHDPVDSRGDQEDLLDAIQQALGRDCAARRHSREIEELHERFDALTSREREVMSLVVAGWLNKQIGFELGIKREHGQD